KQYNRHEFHHIYPRAYLDSNKITTPLPNCLANFCFMARKDNVDLGGVAPSQYRSKMPSDVSQILARALCPKEVFSDDYQDFVGKRAELLSREAEKLIS
ncbi:MAG: hypothetical protein KF726_15445, partial [Anaerolineae bacterium]|nr:hypothetical protein [Anaerolineae bacterium]